MIKRLQRIRGKDEEGFTLVELLVVVVILGILAAVVVFAVGGINDKGQDSACKTDTQTIRTAEEAFLAQVNNGLYSTEIGLVPNFLSTESELHDVTFTGTDDPLTTTVNEAATSYAITVDSIKCGTVGANAGTPGNL